MIFQPLTLAIIGGFIPAIIWLWFWLLEDKNNPEPKKIIARAFLYGMIVVLIALPLERLVSVYFSQTLILSSILFALVEELLKYGAAYWAAIRTKHCDEPVDVVIYMIVSALGFAAVENTLFLIKPYWDSEFAQGLITGNLRFIGANLLHIASSATIGVFLALAFYQNRFYKKFYFFYGLILAVLLHGLFNFSIINYKGSNLILIFGLVWLSIIILILLLEKIKAIKKTL